MTILLLGGTARQPPAGFDTHALSAPAFATTMEVLAANKVEAMIAVGDEYTPTPVISHAILQYNKGKKTGLQTAL